MTLGMTLSSLGVSVPDPGMQMGNLIQPLLWDPTRPSMMRPRPLATWHVGTFVLDLLLPSQGC